MAIAPDQVLNAGSAGSQQTNHTFNTSAAAASGSIIWVFAHRFNNTNTTLTCSGGSLTWTAAPSGGVTSGTIRMYAFWAYAPSGLASGTTITITGSASGNDYTVCAFSYTGQDTTTPVRATNTGSGSTTAWTTGTVAGNSGDTYIGCAAGDGTLRTSTPTAPATERIDFNSATSSGSITAADEIGGSASDAVAGTWSGNLGHVRIGIAMAPASGDTPVSNTWALSYSIQNSVSRTWALAYNLLNAISRTWGLSYSIQNSVSREWGLVYSLINAISREWGLSYQVAGNITREWALRYDIANSASREWSLTYNVGDVVGALIAELISAKRGLWQPDVYTVGKRI